MAEKFGKAIGPIQRQLGMFRVLIYQIHLTRVFSIVVELREAEDRSFEGPRKSDSQQGVFRRRSSRHPISKSKR